jgi:xanthine dehydrogenase YagS FAD-binding subunit
MHAILGTSEACIATHPSDMCVALAALDATAHAAGPRGTRAIAFLDFHRLPENMPQRDTNLQPNEIITAAKLPARGFAARHTYQKNSRSPLLCVCARVGSGRAGAGWKHNHRGSAGVRRRRAQALARLPAEAALRGQTADKPAFARAAHLLLRDAKGFEDTASKIARSRAF